MEIRLKTENYHHWVLHRYGVMYCWCYTIRIISQTACITIALAGSLVSHFYFFKS